MPSAYAQHCDSFLVVLLSKVAPLGPRRRRGYGEAARKPQCLLHVHADNIQSGWSRRSRSFLAAAGLTSRLPGTLRWHKVCRRSCCSPRRRRPPGARFARRLFSPLSTALHHSLFACSGHHWLTRWLSCNCDAARCCAQKSNHIAAVHTPSAPGWPPDFNAPTRDDPRADSGKPI